MSCTNNSTISGIIIAGANSTAASGKRLSFQQNTSTNWNSSISAGDVIRYDVDAAGFTKSIANPEYDSNGVSNAEVIGIVETIEQISGVTYATIVTSGLMNYPGLTATIAGISASSGGIGGTDIFFLSPTTPGGITFQISEGNGYIAKPVLQVCPTSDGSYNSVVVNYLGYETAQSADFTVGTSETSVGELKLVTPQSLVPDGWIDAATSQFLLKTEYPDAYALYRTTYGSYEVLTVNASSSFISGLLGSYIRPIDQQTNRGLGQYVQIIATDSLNNTVTIQNGSSANLWEDDNFFTQYELQTPVSGLNRISVTNGLVTHFKTPIITTNIIVNYGQVNVPFKTLIRVKPDNRVSYLPDNANFNNISVGGTLGTPDIANVNDKLVQFESRIQAIETILGI